MRTKCLLTAALIALTVTDTAAFAASQVTVKSVEVKSGPVKSETLKFEPFKAELARPEGQLYTGRSAYRGIRGRVGFAPAGYHVAKRHGRGYVDLVGDRESGYGFYPLPEPFRAGAARYRYRLAHRYYGPYGNPLQQAVIDDAVRSWSWAPASAVYGYRYGVFDPIDGVGTPFFAGYYSAGTRDAADGPEPIFGNPLD
jgi:hypothetical protein